MTLYKTQTIISNSTFYLNFYWFFINFAPCTPILLISPPLHTSTFAASPPKEKVIIVEAIVFPQYTPLSTFLYLHMFTAMRHSSGCRPLLRPHHQNKFSNTALVVHPMPLLARGEPARLLSFLGVWLTMSTSARPAIVLPRQGVGPALLSAAASEGQGILKTKHSSTIQSKIHWLDMWYTKIH